MWTPSHARAEIDTPMKYVWLCLVLASLAGLEIYHELSSGEGWISSLCAAPDTQQDTVRDLLLRHLSRH